MQQQGDLRIGGDESLREVTIDHILPLVSKPNQYIGNELNVCRKDHSGVQIRFALAYPDTYYIGMSHQGLKILYHILNRRADALAERVFAPWVDMESQMRKRGIPLFSLESHIPVRDFDVLGFTLQHELTFTNVLNMIDLAGIPVRAGDREARFPLILAGGSCASNPEPLADFIDAFVLGDGEEVVEEIVDLLREAKGAGWERDQTLLQLSHLEGLYVPSLYRPEYNPQGRFQSLVSLYPTAPQKIRARIIPRLDLRQYPLHPLVPLTEIAQDRLSIEIMRGCSRGCRYCHAGMVYRPVREKTPQDVVHEALQGIASSGWDEISLVSLSSSDYSCLLPLVTELNRLLADKKVTLSLPSLRPDAFTEKLAQAMKNMRRTGLTFAPESGTTRLRRVINKDFRPEDLLQTLRIAFENGWESVKLYFMIGLPTETWDDLKGIIEMGHQVHRFCGKKGRREIHLSISPFTPKPHTPFQWESQDAVEVLLQKVHYLKAHLSRRGMRVNWRDPHVSFLEGVFARGDRRLGPVLEQAWRSGSTFDSWTERFNYSRWQRAFAQAGIDPQPYVGPRSLAEPLPWEHIGYGVRRQFLRDERDRALQGQLTPDCRMVGCHRCGAHRAGLPRGKNTGADLDLVVPSPPAYGRGQKPQPRGRAQVAKTMMRVQYAKEEALRYLSHLDMIRLFERALRRTDLPIAHTEGFHPHPKIAFGPPLPLGLTSRAEFLDIQFVKPWTGDLAYRLSAVLPAGIRILATKSILRKTESLTAAITVADYHADLSLSAGAEDLGPAIRSVLLASHLPVQRITPKETKVVDIRGQLLDLSLESGGQRGVLSMRLHVGQGGHARPQEIVSLVMGRDGGELTGIPIERTAQFIETGGRLISPMEAI